MYESTLITKFIVWFIASAISAVCYRLGGAEGFNTKIRDLGVPTVCTGLIILLGIPDGLWSYLALIPSFGIMFGTLTTYRYFLPKPTDYTWVHYALHGFMVALALFPFAWATGLWLGFIIRVLTCAIGVGAWSHFTKWDILEEGGRGFIICATIPLLMIGG